MLPVLPLCCSLLILVEPEPIQTSFVQVHPQPKQAALWERSAGQPRAVVLVNGLRIHPIQDDNVAKAEFHGWQKPGSALVEVLSKDADLFAFAYGQNASVDAVASQPGLREGIQRLKRLGYLEIVLVGHSAGGLVARQFVEDHPEVGITKVIQVCAPNGGSSWGKARFAVRKNQEVFLTSLTKGSRELCLKERAEKKVPDVVQFICLVGHGAGTGDGLVSCRSQWPEDLQGQGIPALALDTIHILAMHSRENAEKIAAAIRDRLPRWNADEVDTARKKLFNDRD